MTAQDLLNTLLHLQLAGVDLSKLEIITEAADFVDKSGQSYYNENCPKTIEISDQTLRFIL
jgi:hypothetical protein